MQYDVKRAGFFGIIYFIILLILRPIMNKIKYAMHFYGVISFEDEAKMNKMNKREAVYKI